MITMKWRIGTGDWMSEPLTDKSVRELLEESARRSDRYAPFIEANIAALLCLRDYRSSILKAEADMPQRCQNIPIHLVP